MSRNVMGQLKVEGSQGDTGEIRKRKGQKVVTKVALNVWFAQNLNDLFQLVCGVVM